MSGGSWFNRLIEYWSLPEEAGRLLDHVRGGRVQVVQMGNFGPDFYSVAEDSSVARSWAGMPRVGIAPNLELAAELIPRVQAAGARVVGQFSMTMHFGDHLKGLGLFGEIWGHLWTPELLGPAPAAGAAGLCQQGKEGGLNPQVIEGRPYRTYRGCICNPGWRALLKAMVDLGLRLGLDGFNATHNYEGLCACLHCAAFLRGCLRRQERLGPEQLRVLFAGCDLEQVEDPRQVDENAPALLRERFAALLFQAGAAARKEAFDEVFIAHGRARKPGLLLAQWYHKYGLRVNDERAGLSREAWARGEDYLWYSQGPHRWGSSLAQGYLADMGLPARFMHAAGGGRPFVVNKYDYRRWRVWAAEAAAHGGAALAFHAGPPDPGQLAAEEYYGPVIRAQRFLAEHEELLHPAAPWSQAALVYPRRAEREGRDRCLDVLKRLGEWLEDAHVLFDLCLDEQLSERLGAYRVAILPEVERLSRDEVEGLRRFAAAGGCLLFTGATGTLDLDGAPHHPDPLEDWRRAGQQPRAGFDCRPVGEAGRVLCLGDGPWQPESVAIRTLENVALPVYRRLPEDPVGRIFIDSLERACGGFDLRTDAPWYVRVRAWRPASRDALVLHWINYLQDEQAALEVPIPVGPLQVECRLPSGWTAAGVEWRYPEMAGPCELPCEVSDRRVRFSIPRLIVHGMALIHQRL
jgi:hypothetical protein